MMRVHLQIKRYIAPAALVGISCTMAGLAIAQQTTKSSKLTTDSNASVNGQTQVSANADNAPSVVIDGTPVPSVPGHSKLDLGDGRSVDVTQSGDTLTVRQNDADDGEATNTASVHINVSSSDDSNTRTRTSVRGTSRTTTSANSNLHVRLDGTGSVQINQ